MKIQFFSIFLNNENTVIDNGVFLLILLINSAIGDINFTQKNLFKKR
jgi:hypothetical protein